MIAGPAGPASGLAVPNGEQHLGVIRDDGACARILPIAWFALEGPRRCRVAFGDGRLFYKASAAQEAPEFRLRLFGLKIPLVLILRHRQDGDQFRRQLVHRDTRNQAVCALGERGENDKGRMFVVFAQAGALRFHGVG